MPLTFAMSQPLLRKRLLSFPQASTSSALPSTLNHNAEARIAYNMLARICSLPDGFSLYQNELNSPFRKGGNQRVNSLPVSGAGASTSSKKTHARATTGLAVPGQHHQQNQRRASFASSSVLDIGVSAVASPQSIAFSPQLALLKAAFASTMIDWAGTERAGNASSSSSSSSSQATDSSVAATTDASVPQQDAVVGGSSSSSVTADRESMSVA